MTLEAKILSHGGQKRLSMKFIKQLASPSSSVVRSLLGSFEFPGESRGNPSSFYHAAATEQCTKGCFINCGFCQIHLRGNLGNTFLCLFLRALFIVLTVPSVVEVLHSLESSIHGPLTKINTTLGDISEKLCALVSKQKGIEEIIGVHSSVNTYPAVLNTALNDVEHQFSWYCVRVHTTYIIITIHQNKNHLIHKSFDEDKQFRFMNRALTFNQGWKYTSSLLQDN